MDGSPAALGARRCERSLCNCHCDRLVATIRQCRRRFIWLRFHGCPFIESLASMVVVVLRWIAVLGRSAFIVSWLRRAAMDSAWPVRHRIDRLLPRSALELLIVKDREWKGAEEEYSMDRMVADFHLWRLFRGGGNRCRLAGKEWRSGVVGRAVAVAIDDSARGGLHDRRC